MNSGSAMSAPSDGKASARILPVVIVGIDEAGGGLIRVTRHLVHPVTITAHYTLHFLSTTCAQACG